MLKSCRPAHLTCSLNSWSCAFLSKRRSSASCSCLFRSVQRSVRCLSLSCRLLRALLLYDLNCGVLSISWMSSRHDPAVAGV